MSVPVNTNANLKINMIAMIVTTISFLLYLPAKSCMITYAIAPIPIPFAIEYVKGIMMSVKNAGTAEQKSVISISAKFLSISTPTQIEKRTVVAE